ncbi:MAG: hypothetical protein NTW19_05475 [Planctomycetota bacterium]|nr:hypothetical protein [Planctomycetota bacterium]
MVEKPTPSKPEPEEDDFLSADPASEGTLGPIGPIDDIDDDLDDDLEDDDEPDEPPVQTWRPKQGPGTKIVAWLILVLLVLGMITMVALVVMKRANP